MDTSDLYMCSVECKAFLVENDKALTMLTIKPATLVNVKEFRDDEVLVSAALTEMCYAVSFESFQRCFKPYPETAA